jgi:hypothetical protein
MPNKIIERTSVRRNKSQIVAIQLSTKKIFCIGKRERSNRNIYKVSFTSGLSVKTRSQRKNSRNPK